MDTGFSPEEALSQLAKALRDSEEREGELEKLSSHAFLLVGTDGTILYASKSTVRVMGFSPAEYVGRNCLDFVHPDDLTHLTLLLARSLRSLGQPMWIEYRTKHRNGSWRFLEGAIINPFCESPIDAAILTYRDITERKRREEMHSHFFEIVEASSDAVIRQNLEGEIVLCNPATERLFGYTAEEVIGKSVALLLAPDRRHEVAQILEGILRGELIKQLETVGIRKHGSKVDVCLTVIPMKDASGRIIGSSAVVSNITERKRKEEALDESQRRYRTLVENAPEAIVVLDVEAGHFTDVNEIAVRLFGVPRESLLKISFAEISPPQQPDGRSSRDAALERIRKALAGDAQSFEWIHWDASGRDIPCEVRLVRLPAAGRQVIRGSITDITERKSLEEQLRQSQKMEAIGLLAGGIAHDFNNLLTTILGYSDLVIEKLGAANPLRGDMGEIKQAGARAAALTQQLLAFSRKQVVEPKVLNLNAIVTEMDSMLRRLIDERIRLLIREDAALGRVKADRSHIEQVIMNLAGC